MAPTIKDIAKKANVSYATVSRALNDKYGVKRQTREKVIHLANSMGYTPNAIARGLVKQQTQSIGLIIPDIANPFFPEVARGVEDAANKRGYSIFLCNTNYDNSREIQYLNLLAEKRVDGIILVPIHGDPCTIENGYTGNSIPVVYACTRKLPDSKRFVVIDDERGGFLATKHLIEKGYMTIGFIGADESSHSNDERLAGYKLALKKYNVPIHRKFIKFGDFKRETGYRIIRRMIRKKSYPRAVMAGNDFLALGVLQGIKEIGLRVPEDIAVVGFDDIPLASFPEIQLTTISQPKYELGKLTVNILLDGINGVSSQPKKLILEPRLVVRKSS